MNIKPLHIVHTETLAGPGGQTLRVLNEASGILERGHQVTLFCRPDTYLYREAQKRGIPSFSLLTKKVSLSPSFQLRNWLKNNHVDIINTHSSADSWMVAIAQFGLKKKAKVVRTRHMKKPVKKNLLSWWLYTRATQFIVTTGEEVRHELIKANKFDATRIRSFPSGIDHRQFRPAEPDYDRSLLGLPQDKTIIGMVSIFNGGKGHDVLIRAAGLLKDKNYHWVLVGDVNRQSRYREDLENLAREEGVADQITFAGFQSEVAPWLQAMDIFCLPTSLNEGVPQVIMQAMLCRLPVITTPMGSISDAIEHMETGVLIEPRKPEALADAIIELESAPQIKNAIAERGYQKALSCFTQEIMLDGMERIFYDLCGG